MSGPQSGQAVFQLINTLAAGGSSGGLSGSFTNTIHEVWYLFGYPSVQQQNVDAVVVSTAAANAGGSTQNVIVWAASRAGVLVQQDGPWVLARTPTIVETNGGLALDPNLVTDGFLRLAYDATTDGIAISRFNMVKQLQIYDSNNVLIFSGAPVPGLLPPLSPIGYNPNGYTPSAVHFDGATGLVTADTLATNDTGVISFAGWFNIDPSATGELEFSQGSGGNSLFYDTPLPAPGWFHMMGTIDAGANQALLLVNGDTASGNPMAIGSAFNSAPTNNTSFYIGTDTQGNFYKGDIADLSIWFDTSFIFNGGVPPTIIAKFVNISRTMGGVTTIEPINPFLSIFGSNIIRKSFRWDDPDLFENLEKELIPDIFLAGPASKLYGHSPTLGGFDIRIQELADLTTYTGTLTNAATAPGKIVIVPT